jgi:hypothetical protein
MSHATIPQMPPHAGTAEEARMDWTVEGRVGLKGGGFEDVHHNWLGLSHLQATILVHAFIGNASRRRDVISVQIWADARDARSNLLARVSLGQWK